MPRQPKRITVKFPSLNEDENHIYTAEFTVPFGTSIQALAEAHSADDKAFFDALQGVVFIDGEEQDRVTADEYSLSCQAFLALLQKRQSSLAS